MVVKAVKQRGNTNCGGKKRDYAERSSGEQKQQLHSGLVQDRFGPSP